MKKYQKENCAFFIGALVFILISTVFATILQFFKGDALDFAITGDTYSTIVSILLLILFIALEILFYHVYKRLSIKYTVLCTKSLKQDIFESILSRDYISHTRCSQGEYIAKYTTQADTIKERHFSMQPLLFEILFKILLVSAALFVLDLRIAIITLLLLTTPLYIPKLIEKRLQNAQSAHLKAVTDTLSHINDWLSGFEVIKNYSIERHIFKHFISLNDDTADKLLHDMKLGAISQLITTLISYLSYFIVLVCAIWLVIIGEFSAGDFFIAIGMIDQLSYPLISLAGIIRQLIAVKPACRMLEDFIDQGKNSSSYMEKDTLQKDTLHSHIRFKGVTFQYKNKPPILLDLNFTMEKGKRYLLRGPSGCGKTTAVNLLLKYYNTASGSIEIDDIPIEKLKSTYDLITIVRQDATLFSDTLRNNLTLFQDIDDAVLIKLLPELGLSKFASKDALDSLISENGSNLSGGEKKRICLARALLKDADVLILDEPLANLDEATSKKIEDLLLSIKGKTILIVSHQFSEEKLNSFDDILELKPSTVG